MFSRAHAILSNARFGRLRKPLGRVIDLAEDVLIGIMAVLICAWVLDLEADSYNGDFLVEYVKEFFFALTACCLLGLILAAGLRFTASSPKANVRRLSQHRIRSELLRLAAVMSAIVVSIKGVSPQHLFFSPLMWQTPSSAKEHLLIPLAAYLAVAVMFLSAIGAMRWGRWPPPALSINPRTFLKMPRAGIGLGLPWYQLSRDTRTSVAVLMSLAVLAIGVGARTVPDWRSGHYFTDRVGRIVQLRDGSDIVLNRNTEIDARVTLLRREIRLIRGEIQLNAMGVNAWHDMKLFIDDVRMWDFMRFHAHVRRLGPQRMEITLISGHAHVVLPPRFEKINGSRYLVLRANQRVTIEPNSILVAERGPESILNDLAWATVGAVQ